MRQTSQNTADRGMTQIAQTGRRRVFVSQSEDFIGRGQWKTSQTSKRKNASLPTMTTTYFRKQGVPARIRNFEK